MKLTLDSTIFTLQRAGGISTYWYELLKRLDSETTPFIHFQQPNSNILAPLLNHAIRHERSLLPGLLLRYLPFKTTLTTPTLFHSSYYRYSRQKGVANITTVHDFTYEYFNHGLKKQIHSWQKSQAVRHSAGVICVSENTRRDLLQFYPDIDPNRVSVIHNGVSEEFYPLPPEQPPSAQLSERPTEPFLLFVGDRSGYKNFPVALELLHQFRNLSLVVVGGREWTLSELQAITPLQERVVRFSGLGMADLNWLYNRAFALIYPSLYEGFGIPVLEAMRAGCPVVAFNGSSIPEVAGEAGLLVDEATAEAFSAKIVFTASH